MLSSSMRGAHRRYERKVPNWRRQGPRRGRRRRTPLKFWERRKESRQLRVGEMLQMPQISLSAGELWITPSATPGVEHYPKRVGYPKG